MSETPEDVYRAAAEAYVDSNPWGPPQEAERPRRIVETVARPDLRAVVDAVRPLFETAGREAAAQAIEPTFTRAQIDRAVHFAECRNGKPRDWRYFTDLGDDEECDCGYYPAAEIARGETREV